MSRFISAVLIIAIAIACKSKKNNAESSYQLDSELTWLADYDEGYPVTNDSIDPDAPYKDEEYVKYYHDYYKDKSAPPSFDFNMDISGKSFQELRELRAEIFARHGFLFMDYVMRSTFNNTSWYKPVFWYNNFQIKLSEQEKNFTNKILEYERNLYKNNYITVNGQVKANLDNLVNLQQFDHIDTLILQHLKNDGFVINQAEHYQLFHIYDKNYYDYTPSFITTDLYLQVLHMHISKELQLIEEEKMIPMLSGFLSEQTEIISEMISSTNNPTVKQAADWTNTYYNIARSLLDDKDYQVNGAYSSLYKNELSRLRDAQGIKSEFLGDSLFDYTQFQPRGNYTRTDSLKNYFKCVKWLNSASLYADVDEGLSRSVIMAYALLKSGRSFKTYQDYSGIISFLAGEENNLSLSHLTEVLRNFKNVPLPNLLSSSNLEKIRAALYAKDPRKFYARGSNQRTEEFLHRKKLLFTSGRYTFDGEILQRLVHITEPQPKRPFPKGLDIFAVTGNKHAEDILLNVYKEDDYWENYSDTLNVLKKKFQNFSKWDISVYNKQMQTLLSFQNSNEKEPYFMRMPAWQLKNLNTMLASWTELKHDMILYIEQPSAAEMGDGGEVPPPQKIAYVEPQIEFWKKCLEMLELNSRFLSDQQLVFEKLKYRNDQLIEIAQLLLAVSKKEIDGEYLTSKELDELSYLGGRIESLTLKIIDSDRNSIYEVSSPEKYAAVAADVYTYNDGCLEECVGFADEIYAVVEINGLLYIARGAVFSHYEFIQPTSLRLTDEKWQEQLLDNQIPPVAPWMKEIKINVEKLSTKPNFNLY